MEIDASRALSWRPTVSSFRHFRPDDLDALAAIQADPEVMRFFPSGPQVAEREPRRARTVHRAPGASTGSASGRRSTGPTAA